MRTNMANKADSISNKEFLVIICASNNKTPIVILEHIQKLGFILISIFLNLI